MMDGDVIAKLLLSIIAAVGTLVIFLMSYYQVDQYERAVLTRFGRVVEVSDPGLHFKVPFVYSVYHYRTDIQQIQPQKPANTYTIDNQEVDVIFTVFYRIAPDRVQYVYENVQDYQERLSNMALDRLKAEMGTINVQHVAEQRGKIRDRIKATLLRDTEALGVLVTDFQLTDLTYTKSFRAAVEAAAAAKAMVETREQERVQAIKVAEKVKIAAEGEASAVFIRAQADAKAIELKGKAEAAAIRAQAEALQQNARLVELRKAERWDGKLPLQLLSGIVPFMQFSPPEEREGKKQ